MGRLSTFAKNRILNLRFQKSYRIKQIANALLQENEIKVSRKSISTFLKKYIETKSINDKPRSGRTKKLTNEEINLIGELTRLNRDLTASKIKEYLNLNVSTYTILRASKLFEWNKMNPHSNQAKKAATMERKLNENATSTTTKKIRKKYKKMKTDKKSNNESLPSTNDLIDQNHANQLIKIEPTNLSLIDDIEIDSIKKISSSPMVFATKILLKIFNSDELIGHNVSGKTFSKILKDKKPLDEKRIGYIRWLIENNFESNNKDDLWRSCRTAINKCIRFNESKCTKNKIQKEFDDENNNENDDISKKKADTNDNSVPETIEKQIDTSYCNNMIVENSINQLHHQLYSVENYKQNNSLELLILAGLKSEPTTLENIVSVEKNLQPIDETETKIYMDISNNIVKTKNDQKRVNLNLISDSELDDLKNSCNVDCRPGQFAIKLLLRLFSTEELIGHKVPISYDKHLLKDDVNKCWYLDEARINYIKWIVGKYFDDGEKFEIIWTECRRAINTFIVCDFDYNCVIAELNKER